MNDLNSESIKAMTERILEALRETLALRTKLGVLGVLNANSHKGLQTVLQEQMLLLVTVNPEAAIQFATVEVPKHKEEHAEAVTAAVQNELEDEALSYLSKLDKQ